MAKKPVKIFLLWEDNKGKFHKVDAFKAIPTIAKEMTEQWRTITLYKPNEKMRS